MLLHDLFIPNTEIHEHNTRNKDNPHVLARKTNFISNTFLHQSPKIWHNIPVHIKNAKITKSFSFKFTSLLLSEYS